MNNVQSHTSFTSTVLPITKGKSGSKVINELSRYFELKGLGGSASVMRDSISLGQTGVGCSKDGMLFVGKEKSADQFIHRVIKQFDSNAKYIDDAPEMKVDGPVLEILG